jgi:CRP-like cAMP-binding protein
MIDALPIADKVFDNVLASIHQAGRFTEQEKSLFVSKLTPKTFGKKDFLLKEGQVCRALYFVHSGAIRQYRFTDSGAEITGNLFIENDWALDLESFISQKPSAGFLESYEQSEVFELNVHDIHSLIAVSQSFLALGKLFNSGIRDARYDSFASPEEKYSCLINTRPAVLQKFSLKHIASYLGVTPETLSRVRRKIR